MGINDRQINYICRKEIEPVMEIVLHLTMENRSSPNQGSPPTTNQIKKKKHKGRANNQFKTRKIIAC